MSGDMVLQVNVVGLLVANAENVGVQRTVFNLFYIRKNINRNVFICINLKKNLILILFDFVQYLSIMLIN